MWLLWLPWWQLLLEPLWVRLLRLLLWLPRLLRPCRPLRALHQFWQLRLKERKAIF